jgi:hypothetical protein
MIKFFRKIRQSLLKGNKFGKYLLYAIGEIILVVIGILIAVQINGWNEKQRLLKKEIDILKAFDHQFQSDLNQFDECLAFYKESENSIDIILDHLENKLSYNDSLDKHFFYSTRVYVDADMANNVFETLQTDGTNLISNEAIRTQIVLLYEDEDLLIKDFESKYIDFLFHASETLFPTRFEDFWQGDYMNVDYAIGSMTPLNFDHLKEDQEYLYFLKTQKNQLGWLIKRPIMDTSAKIIALREAIKEEIKRLEAR